MSLELITTLTRQARYWLTCIRQKTSVNNRTLQLSAYSVDVDDYELCNNECRYSKVLLEASKLLEMAMHSLMKMQNRKCENG
tara:strand:- start:38 stop:283 length:246 start_codon:yes stop_codon:yes gene_type:complete